MAVLRYVGDWVLVGGAMTFRLATFTITVDAPNSTSDAEAQSACEWLQNQMDMAIDLVELKLRDQYPAMKMTRD